MVGVEKRGGEGNLTNDTPPKRGFGPPSHGTFSNPPQVSVLCFACTKSTTEQTRSSFGGVQKSFGRARSLVRFPPPIRFATHPYHGPSFSVFSVGLLVEIAQNANNSQRISACLNQLLSLCDPGACNSFSKRARISQVPGVTPGKPNQTKERPLHELFPGALWNQSSM